MADPTQDPSLALPNTPNFINPAYATPQQRQMLYEYSKALMQPQPIKSGWQGLASIANALVGGYMHHQADVQEQASRANTQGEMMPTGGQATAAPAAPSPMAPPPAAPGPVANGSPGYPDAASAQSYAAQVAPKYGIEPKTAAAIVGAEYGDGSNYLGDGGSSGGPLQLHYGGVNPKMPRPGLGDDFTAATGLDARDPKNWQATIDFGLANAAKQGWEPWKNSRDKLGWSNSTGIGAPATPDQSAAAADIAARERAAGTGGNLTQAQATAIATGQPPPAAAPGGMGYAPGVPPAVAAMGAALAPARGRMAQAGGPAPAYSAGQLAAIIADPNLPPEIRAHAFELTQPKPAQDVLGNVSPVYQGQSVGAPIFHGGAPGPVVGGVASSVLSGTPTNPTSTLAVPEVAGTPPPARGGLGGAAPSPAPPGNIGAAILGPNSVAGSIIAQQQANEARGRATTDVAGGSADQYVRDMQGAINYQRSALPLQKAIPALERLGEQGTGPGTETWNEVMSFLNTSGVPGIDTSKIKDFAEAKKYLVDFVNQTGDHGTNERLAASFSGNPSVNIDNAAAVDVAKTAATMQRYKQAQVMSFGGIDPATGQPIGKEKYLEHAANFQSKYDARAFGIDMMSPDAIKALDKEMPAGSETREKFNRSLQLAKTLGLVTR